jgi:hypothetical protein
MNNPGEAPVSPFERKRQESRDRIKAAFNAFTQKRHLLKLARSNANKLIHVTPKAHDLLDKFYRTCPIAKREVASLAIIEFIQRNPSTTELLQMWERYRSAPISDLKSEII